MVELEIRPEPSPTLILESTIENLHRKFVAYSSILTITTIIELISFFSVGVSTTLLSGLFQTPLVAIFILVWLIGMATITFSIVGVLVYFYKYARYKMNFQPSIQADTRLKVIDGSFEEIRGIDIGTARSLSYSTLGGLFCTVWPALIDWATPKMDFRWVSSRVGIDQNQLDEIVVTITSVIARTDITAVTGLLTPNEYITIIKFVPILLIGYISFRHFFYFFELVYAEDIGILNEVRNLIYYLRLSATELRKEMNREIRALVGSLLISALTTGWHLFVLTILF